MKGAHGTEQIIYPTNIITVLSGQICINTVTIVFKSKSIILWYEAEVDVGKDEEMNKCKYVHGTKKLPHFTRLSEFLQLAVHTK